MTEVQAPELRRDDVHRIDRRDDHPFRQLTADEMVAAVDILAREGLMTDHTRFV